MEEYFKIGLQWTDADKNRVISTTYGVKVSHSDDIEIFLTFSRWNM